MSFALVLLLLSCGARHAPHEPGTIIVGLDSSPTNLDPRIGIDKASEDFHRLLFNGLLKKDQHDRMVPDLALTFEQASPLLYRFVLRKDVRFHNGRLLTAEDVVFTYNSILNGLVSSTKKASLDSISAVRAAAPDVVEVELREPFNGLLVNMNVGIVPAGSGADFADHPIGTGPYKLIRFEADQEALLEAFPGYFGGPPRTRYLKLRIIPDATTRALELRKGGVDLMMGTGIVPPDYFRILKQDPFLKTMTSTGNNYSYIGFNMTDPILRKREVRQAIACAINRQEMVSSLFYGAAEPATGLLAPHNWAYEGNVMRFSYDPEKARRMLDAAGYRDPDGPGPKVRFRLAYKISTNEFRRLVATVLQRNLADVGIGLDIRSYEWGTFFSDVNRGNFQMCMLIWIGESDPDIYRNVFSTSGTRNRGKYSDADVDDWVNRAKIAASETEQIHYYSLVQKKVAEDCPYVSLWYESNIAVFRSELQGVRLTPGVDFAVLRDIYW
ncbi:MAG TPA: ABC transporter substrate-binding protein [Acidobacteriota bacterium]|nr:ABC transporter substrate-binding protein [Acidobacteriota bacterium]